MNIDVSKNLKLGVFGVIFVLGVAALFSSDRHIQIAGMAVMAAVLITVKILDFKDFGAASL